MDRNERCVYSGECLRLYERDQEQFDGSTKVFERVERASDAFILPVLNGEIMLVHQRQSHKKEWFYSHVGGRIEWGEEPLVGAKRELLEETGCIPDSIELYRNVSLSEQMSKKNTYM